MRIEAVIYFAVKLLGAVKPLARADEDAAINKNLDAAFTAAGLTGVKHKTKNGVVVLTGKVPAAATRSQAELAASQIANVQQVVNEIQATQN